MGDLQGRRCILTLVSKSKTFSAIKYAYLEQKKMENVAREQNVRMLMI